MLYFITSNKPKIIHARLTLDKYNIPLKTQELPIIEIQSDQITDIALDKANKAFEIIKQPLLVKDDGWYISDLKGFPGPYMKYVNTWFTTEDFIKLLSGRQNREVIFREAVCYKDNSTTKIFLNKIKGQFLDQPAGHSFPFSALVTFRGDKKTIAQCDNEKIPFGEKSVWDDFAVWYKTYHTALSEKSVLQP